jgi:hypothetical protein
MLKPPHPASALGTHDSASPKIDAANANILLLVMTIPSLGNIASEMSGEVVEALKGLQCKAWERPHRFASDFYV